MSGKSRPFSIALLGALPPPYGGVSIHIQRLKHELEEIGIKCVVYDFSAIGKDTSDNDVITVKNPKLWLLKYLFCGKESIIHNHMSDWRLRTFIGLMTFRGKKTVISIHGASLKNSLAKGNWIEKQLIKFALRSSSFIIALNTDIEKLCLSLGVKSDRLKVIPAFIPPRLKTEEFTEIPQEIWNFVKNHSPIISANAFKIVFYNHVDLYGIDMCIDLCANLKNRWQNLGFIFCLPQIGDYSYFEKMKRKITERGTASHFLLVTKPYQFYPILRESSVFVRPTTMDGDAVSIREALYFKIPVVASDVTPRPEGTILFKNRDIGDFTTKVATILDNYELHKKKMENTELNSGFLGILDVYRRLSGDGREH